MWRGLLAGLCAVLLTAGALRAQSDNVMLLADSVLVQQGGDTLVATGNVEALYQGTRLTASTIV